MGADGPGVSAVGLGCMSARGATTSIPQEEAVSERTLQRAVELGVTHFDTASLYGRGHNETLVGTRAAQPPARGADRLQVRPRESRLPAAEDPARRPPETIRRHCEGSLARLGLDVLDLYYLHRVDPDVPVEESFGALSRARGRGQDPTPRDLRVHGRRARARPRHAPGERAAERVLAVDARAARRT